MRGGGRGVQRFRNCKKKAHGVNMEFSIRLSIFVDRLWLLIAKCYIYSSWLHGEKLCFDSFLALSETEDNIHREIAIGNNTISSFNNWDIPVSQLSAFFQLWVLIKYTVFSRLNAGGVYLNLGLVEPAFIRTRRLFGAQRLFIKCIFQPFIFVISTRGLLN